ncbi:fumarylacetoacetase (plasmid) [Rhizobium sp. ACO-34A]|nr:fumarylacetoacetase [Rhizobium sp. ACO-34A]ATN36951.1 fumarylacetoacetase [Rhizobium sp. ACO-34A]
MVDETHDPARRSWVRSAQNHRDFPLQNLPLGIFLPPSGGAPRGGIAIGDQVLDLAETRLPGSAADLAELCAGRDLNALLALGADARRSLRHAVFRLLAEGQNSRSTAVLHPQISCRMQVPATVGDYTDFYAGIHHARNVGKQFRPDAPLLPNYRHIPIGYHGRASTLGVGGEVYRPSGQTMRPGSQSPVFGPTAALDYEVELGFWVGAGNRQGSSVPISRAGEHLAGISLLNDWSARDIQRWEYQPLGPFLAKSFATTLSPWIVTMEALAPFRCAQPPRPAEDPTLLPYLSDPGDLKSGSFALSIETFFQSVEMTRRNQPAIRLASVGMEALYWTPAQLLAHHTSNGCALRPGDLLGSGTISGQTIESYGSLLELTQDGRVPITLPDGTALGYLRDGDTIELRAQASAEGFVSIGFGACRATVQQAMSNLDY